MRQWEKITDKCMGNLKFRWANFVSKILWLATKSLPFTNLSTLKVFSSYFYANSHTNTVISDTFKIVVRPMEVAKW